jgi:hypothetical protein
MSFHVFFAFSTGLVKPLHAPLGTKVSIAAHVEEVETALGLKRISNGIGEDYPIYWDYNTRPGGASARKIDDEVMCRVVSAYNKWVRQLYDDFEEWASKPPDKFEVITEKDAAGFWFALVELKVPPERWSREYYVERMEHLYTVMRGHEDEGVNFDAKALTPKQAAAVIRIFDRYLDDYDARLDVPHGHDHLASSYDGGYDWCGTCCRPMIWEDAMACRRRKCELRERDER